ncbi:MAG: CheR family methyltransferase [Planctomycetaceae bacterium]
MKVADPQFDYLSGLLRRRTGVCIDRSKQYLVVARLMPIVRQRKIPSLETLIDRVRQGVDPSLEKDVLCAMMTHETSFFRDRAPFEALRQVIADFVPKRSAERQLTLWSAACSTGQEPYSMAMTLLEHFRELVATWRIRIIATDFSEPILARAREGVFSELETNRSLPPALLKKYFRPLQGRHSIVQECRQLVEFRSMNLNGTWPMMPLVDVVFLRNVMLYFDVATRSALVGRVRRVLRSDGALFLGGAETMIGIDDGWDRVVDGGCSHYRPKTRR